MIEINPEITKIVWFDIDDTLIDFRMNSRLAMTRLFNNSILRDIFPSIERWWEQYESVNNSLWMQFNKGDITGDYLRKARFELPLTTAGINPADAVKIAPILDAQYLEILSHEKNLIPGAKEILEQMKKTGILTGALSNGFNNIQQQKLKSAGIFRLIDHIVLSDDIGVTKPNILLYKHAMTVSGITEPERHLMIGDNPVTDIDGAIHAGWKAILLDRTNTLFAPPKVEKIKNFSDIRVKKPILTGKNAQK